MENPWAYGDPTEAYEEEPSINTAREPNITSIVGDSAFCVPYPMELIVRKKIQGLSNAHFDVFDVTGNNLLLKVDGRVWTIQKKRIMRDPAGFPVLVLREKVLTCRHQWNCHLGESTDNNNLLFKVQRSNPIQIKTRLEVFLASNFNKNVCDFHVIRCLSSLSFKVYKGKTIIAEVNHKLTWGKFYKGKDC
ncbi:Tub_2 domain-containing protein, partial [Cephalotus follicularis]